MTAKNVDNSVVEKLDLFGDHKIIKQSAPQRKTDMPMPFPEWLERYRRKVRRSCSKESNLDLLDSEFGSSEEERKAYRGYLESLQMQQRSKRMDTLPTLSASELSAPRYNVRKSDLSPIQRANLYDILCADLRSALMKTYEAGHLDPMVDRVMAEFAEALRSKSCVYPHRLLARYIRGLATVDVFDYQQTGATLRNMKKASKRKAKKVMEKAEETRVDPFADQPTRAEIEAEVKSKRSSFSLRREVDSNGEQLWFANKASSKEEAAARDQRQLERFGEMIASITASEPDAVRKFYSHPEVPEVFVVDYFDGYQVVNLALEDDNGGFRIIDTQTREIGKRAEVIIGCQLQRKLQVAAETGRSLLD